jgi:hypothetical protein
LAEHQLVLVGVRPVVVTRTSGSSGWHAIQRIPTDDGGRITAISTD